MKTLLAEGAEAKIYRQKDSILKERIPKSYRLTEIDITLRKSRIRREKKILDKLEKAGFPSPRVQEMNDKEMILSMDFISGEKVRDILTDKNYAKISAEIGVKVAVLHNMNIIHGDLTTSNMILHHEEIYLIDFGLAAISSRIEDKAVDLHLLKQGLESKHYKIWDKAFALVISSYKKKAENSKEILERFEVVESRGRNKGVGS